MKEPEIPRSRSDRPMLAMAQAGESVLLLDDSKLGARGQNAIARVNEVSRVLAHGAPAAALEPLRGTGVKLEAIGD
jgi:DeoR/GlpR family transcriptional regulator of sugar metabolism